MKWTLSDGTTIERVDGSIVVRGDSECAQDITLRLLSPRWVNVDIHPGGDVLLRTDDDWLVTEWLRREVQSYGVEIVAAPAASPPDDVKAMRAKSAKQHFEPGTVY